MGEGAGVLVLESLNTHKKRGVKFMQKSLDRCYRRCLPHIDAPNPDGSGAKNYTAIEEAGGGSVK